jgi:hypothetical protein
MRATSTLIAVKFNRLSLSEFESLGDAGRLSHIAYCHPTGKIDRLTFGMGISLLTHTNVNIYADVLNLGEWPNE